MKRANKNEFGAVTYKAWYTGRNDYRGNVGNDISHNIIVKSAPPAPPIIEAEEVIDEQSETETIDDHIEEEKKSKPSSTNQTVFINNGSGVQIGVNYGSLIFPPHGTS